MTWGAASTSSFSRRSSTATPTQGNRDLIRTAAVALNASGQLVVQGFIPAEGRTGSPFGILLTLNMRVGTDGGDTHPESEVPGWTQDVGLACVTMWNMPFGTSAIAGRRPADAAPRVASERGDARGRRD